MIFKTYKSHIRHQQEVAKKVYKKLKCIFSDLVLAGGAPRNWELLGIPAKDLDFYCVNHYTPSSFTPRLHLEQIFGLSFEKENLNNGKMTVKKSTEYHHPNIMNIYDFEYCGEKIQIMELDSTQRSEDFIWKTFDFEICKICYKFDNEHPIISYGFDFKKYASNKQLALNLSKLYKNPYQMKKLPSRYEKMKKLFPDWELVFI